MGKPSLILAALAADALPGLQFVQVQNLTRDDAAVAVELLTTSEGRLILLKSPLDSLATTDLGTEVRALQVLKNVSLPFSISDYLGKTSPKAIRNALAFEYVPGSPVDLSRLRVDDPLVLSIGQTLSAIHSIPTPLVSDAGLPEYEPVERVRAMVAEFDRAMDTGKIHPDLLERWQTALFDVNLFKYRPTVVHGYLRTDFVLVEGNQVVGITEWGRLSIDDPALDLAFAISEAEPDTFEAIRLTYEGSTRADKNMVQRANLHYELSYASELLESLARGYEDEIAEAVDNLAILHERLVAGLLPSLSPTEFASSNPEVIVPISQAASFTGPVTIVTESIEVVDLAQVSPEAQSEEPKPKKDEDELF
jgi:aminoglycoside phosphotransferase (APT) family kinase protein